MFGPNKRIFLDSCNQLSIQESESEYRPTGDQALIQVYYSGINPADITHGYLGMNDNVCGYEFCGAVIDAGPHCPYTLGDVIFGVNPPGKKRPEYHGAHQDIMITQPGQMSAKAPKELAFYHAAVLSIMVRTAADALFNAFGLEFTLINLKGKTAAGAILIWGGASSVGIAAIQLAKAAGVGPIWAVASSKNHHALRKLGATECFDYQNSDIIKVIQTSIDTSPTPLRYVFDTVCTQGDAASSTMCEQLKCSSDTEYACVLPNLSNTKWKLVVAVKYADFEVFLSTGSVLLKGDVVRDAILQQVVDWAANNYGRNFTIPRVRIVKGSKNAIQAIQESSAGKNSFEKVVVEHPL